MSKKKLIKMEHIDRLSRGKKSGIHIGSRRVGHHLQSFERDIYERSLKKGFLEVDERARDNLYNLWEKVVVVKQWTHVVLVKGMNRVSGRVFMDGIQVFDGTLQEAKQYAKDQSLNNT